MFKHEQKSLDIYVMKHDTTLHIIKTIHKIVMLKSNFAWVML